ncbi:hypothetical protein [Tenacibaculum sp. 190524A02b]|uniref:hypothetical protein n=1 Tax=Tenacibaculum vairaonense TaxID=3137860 RepID=UPI0031FB59C1
MKLYKDYKEVQVCLNLIEEKLQWGKAKNWHNNVFIELSEKIQEETKVLLSPTTLKRVWGRVNYESAPSISTLNTLAQFAGFLNWRDFKSKRKKPKVTIYKQTVLANIRVIMLSAFIIAALFFSIFSMSTKNQIKRADYTKVLFKSRPIANGLPNSVVFDFDLKTIEADDLLIQQYWDPTKTIKIHKKQKQATGQYYYPGYFRAKLLVNKKIIKEHDLFIKSNGWIGTIDYKPIPKYVEEKKVLKNKSLLFAEETINEIKQSSEPVNSTYHYVDDLGNISGDNFELHTSIKHLFIDKWGVCQKTTITIIGTKSAILIPLTISGCVSEIGVMFSEKYFDGKKHDLSPFGTDLSSFKNIKISVKNKQVRVFLNKQEIYNETYTKTLGMVVGVRFKFKGVGEVKGFSLKNLLGKEFLNL